VALTVDAFKESFPEFETTAAGLIKVKLAEALLSIGVDVWRDRADLGQGYLAAHLITLSPKGQNARMIVKNPQGGDQPVTTYWGHYKRLQREVTRGATVAGGLCFSAPVSPWLRG
jgi:hypothetical protein